MPLLEVQQAERSAALNRSPAFQFYPDKWQSHTRRLSDTSYRVFHEMLCWMWQHSDDHCSIQASEEAVACAVAMPSDCVRIALAEILNPFSPLLKTEGDRWVSNGLRKEAVKQTERRTKAKVSADARWKDADAMRTHGQTDANASAKQCFPSPSLIPSPSPSPKTIEKRKFQRPTLDEIKAACAEIGLPEIEAEKFEAHHEARGWKYKQGMMKSWRGALTTWKLNFASGAFSFPAGQPRANQGGGQAAWKRISDLAAELKQLDGLLHAHMDRERNPDKVARREVVRAELAKLKANP